MNKMLDYCKVILEKVSFNQFLFEKEFKKSISYLSSPDEIMNLIHWAQNNYSHKYSDTINEIVKSLMK